MRYLELVLGLPDALHDLLIAELTDLGAEGFEQEDEELRVSIPAASWDDVKRQWLEGWLYTQGAEAHIQERIVEPQNWNATFEASIRPIAVGTFLIRPTWAEPDPSQSHLTELLIDPKMSFGTGYHESTRLVLRMLPEVVQPGSTVLDAGTGTGVLAIAALKLGAARALAFDIDPWAEENAGENFALNGVADRAEVRIGSVEVVPEQTFDLVLANIHREVLIALLPELLARLAPDGTMVLAGLLQTDASAVLSAASAHGLTQVRDATEGNWWAVVLQRKPSAEPDA